MAKRDSLLRSSYITKKFRFFLLTKRTAAYRKRLFNSRLMDVQILFTAGIICFTCRSDACESEEYSYKDKFESLEIQRRWELISNSDSDNYGDQPHPERRSLRARMLVYRILK